MRLEFPAYRSEVEYERVEGYLGEAETQAVEHHDESYGLNLDAGLLEDLLDRHLDRRVTHVGPAGRIQPDSGVRALDQQYLVLLVADNGANRELRSHVTGDALVHVSHPLEDELGRFTGRHRLALAKKGGGGHRTNVARHVQELLVAFAVEKVLGEREARFCDRGKGFRPPDKVSCRPRRLIPEPQPNAEQLRGHNGRCGARLWAA